MLGGAGQGRTGQDRTGQDRTGQDRTGQDRKRQETTVRRVAAAQWLIMLLRIRNLMTYLDECLLNAWVVLVQVIVTNSSCLQVIDQHIKFKI
jgi:hypothetical protein